EKYKWGGRVAVGHVGKLATMPSKDLDKVARRMADAGVAATVLTAWVPRAEFARLLRAADVFVGLPLAAEGFYRPALEAMACGCTVVCADALGNRAFCADGETCSQPAHGDAGEHAEAVLRLLADDDLRTRLRRAGLARAAQFDLARERAGVHAVFDTVFERAAARA
ncbi:MAG TPA: glycosyltransferase, partial [Xanthomonadales bacterium]|nr:glycosyltransferase [Xanthomonadales bacterium]